MLFDELIDRPSQATLSRVLNGGRLDLIAPFARSGPLRQLDPARHHRVRIITRLPRPGDPLPEKLDNDPRHFIELTDRLGRGVEIYGLPGVHTKLYLNGNEAFYGSANFTGFGFGGRPESLLVTSEAAAYRDLATMFETYRAEAARIPVSLLRRLANKLLSGEVDYTATPEQPVILWRNLVGDDEAHFRRWLAGQPGLDPTYIEARFNPASGYNMTGHTQSAFPGIRAFLRENLDLIPGLATHVYVQRAFWRALPDVQARFRRFVQLEGHRFPAGGGGDWRRKLPVSLGGRPGPGGVEGGRGSGLIARMLIYLARYAQDEGF